MFQAGFARVEVTPPFGTALTGYFSLRVSDGVLDPIQLNALAISEGEETILIITGDFMYMNEKDITVYRGLIEKDLGIPASHILIQSIHQHTSTTAGKYGPTDPRYQYFLERKYVDVARMALDDRKEARISLAEKETAEPVSFIRRYRMKDGSVKTNPGYLNPDIDHPLGEADNTVRLVKFEREGAKDIALVNFQTHPDVIGGKKFSADWPGWVRRMTEKDVENVHCILVNGCQGDTNHCDFSKPWITFKGDPEAQAKKYAYSERMGRIITDTVVDIWNKTEEMTETGITARVEMKRVPSNTNGIERIDECRALQKLITNNEPLPVKLNMAEKGEVRRIANMENVTLVQKVPVSMVAFGKVALIGYGGEPFTEYATKPRAAVPELFVLSACLANGGQGYLPSVDAFAEGGYEARTTNFTEVVAPTLQNAALAMLKDHLNR
ncbi:MAG: hypothetical protein IKC69_05215 [Clostridia bacterium]|nr:hypothetical protein [Clostridia bacterium]